MYITMIGLNWWGWGSAEPPVQTHWNALTGQTGISGGGDIEEE